MSGASAPVLPTPVLEVRGLKVGFHTGRGYVRAVDGASFHVDPGETLAILGESGSGKSVSAAAIMNLIDSPPGDIAEGQILFHGHDLLDMNEEKRRLINGERIAMIFQDPLAYLNPVYSVGWQIAEVFRTRPNAGVTDPWGEAVRLLDRVGIPEPSERARRYPHQFSGGQRQRVMIAMALALRPELLVADEPTTALDVTIQAQILELLKSLQAEEGMSLLLITHDLAVAANIADRIAVMYRGEVVEEGPARRVLEHPEHAYTKRLIAAEPGRAGGLGTDRQGQMREEAEVLLQAEHLVKDYKLPGGLFRRARLVRAVRDAGFSIAAGETLGIVGESGSGKSTLARLLLRLDEATGGHAFYRGRDIFAMDEAELSAMRCRVQMVFQDPYGSLNPQLTVAAIIAESWEIHPQLLPKAEWSARIAELLQMVGLEPAHAERYPHQFSGGQRQRIAIARALASEPELVICDEAVSALDVSIQAQIIDLLAGLRDRLGLAYIFITHDLPVVRHFADRILVMKDGEVVEEGTTVDIFERPQHPYTRALLAASPRPKWTAGDEHEMVFGEERLQRSLPTR
ncbi:MAG: ABC transporter ATP-binding protein [Alphaproteobacteria bacterium]